MVRLLIGSHGVAVSIWRAVHTNPVAFADDPSSRAMVGPKAVDPGLVPEASRRS